MRKKAGSVCMALGLLFLAAAVALLCYNRWDNNRAGKESARIQSELESAMTSDEGGFADENTNILSVSKDTETDTEMNTVEIDGYTYIGILTIPALNLELPILSEWSYAGLKISPGRYYGSDATDDLIICGHNYTYHFGNLKYLESGDTLYFTDVNGIVFGYEVQEVILLQPANVEEMISQESGEWDLTLFTCTVGGQTRVTVRCSRTNGTDF